jgi:superfamily II DNA or RNA helicase
VPTRFEAATVRRLLGSTTYARGSVYAARGAVVSATYDPDDDVVVGDVQGSSPRPYEVTIELARSASGTPVGVSGECSCPVGFNCKHVAALLLASGAAAEPGAAAGSSTAGRRKGVGAAARSSRQPAGGPAGRELAPAWVKPFETLLCGLEDHGVATEPEVALQFEVMPRPSNGKKSNDLGIQVRPVVRGSRGRWVRTGISWPKLDYGYLSRDLAPERMALLRELLALSRLSSPCNTYYGYSRYTPDSPLWLEDFSSRRLWDLLRQAEELHVPLVSGSTAMVVHLAREPAVVGVDLVAAAVSGLEMRPSIQAGGEGVPLGSSLLVGRPPHGLAWWQEAAGGRAVELSMARFARPLGNVEQALIESRPLEVPGGDRARFFRDFYPRLARSVAVASSDASVELPELPPVVLVLGVRHEGARSVVRWQRGAEGSSAREDLWERAGPSLEPEIETAVSAATKLVRRLPAMIEQTWLGERLAGQVELSGMDAVRFVTEVLPALAEVPGLVIDQQGEAPDYREAVSAPVVSLRPAKQGFDGDWFDLWIEVAVDGEDVVFHDLFVALAEGQSHLVLPSGTYFALDRPELAELAELIAEARAMQDRDEPTGERVRVSRFQAGLWEDLQRLGVVTSQASAWEEAVRALAEASDEAPLGPPAGMEAALRPYQQAGFSWLAFLYRRRLGGVLADDMGLGKTLQALSLVCHARQQLRVEEPFLVIAPTSVVENWANECRRFAPSLEVATVSETTARRWVSLADLADKADLVVTSYTLFRLEYGDYEKIQWAGLFLDEAQFVKNARSIAYQRARALPTPFKVAMTGTPIENNLKELWALLSISAPGLFPRPDRFVEHYAVPIERRGDTERLSQLRRRIRPLVLRRSKEQVESELPEKQEQALELELAPRHRRLYQTHLQRERQKILGLLGDMDRHRFEILRSLTLLRQAALDISLVDDRASRVPSTKLDVLSDMLAEIVADGHRALVFSQFTRFLQAAAARAGAAGIEHCYLDGRTQKRERVISAFREGSAPVFFISLKAGGFGLNLTEADYCILLDPWWNPATEAQAVDRAHRIGQTRKVMVYRLVAKDTIEEKVMALKAKKAALFKSVLDAGGFERAALSAADIRALVE